MQTSTQPLRSETVPRRLQRRTSTGSDNLSVEEISPDEMGYDADVEVIRPDHYEEADSDSGLESGGDESRTKFQTLDEELAEKMHQLGREQASVIPHAHFIDRGRKRTSWELDNDGSMLDVPMSPGFEVQEMVDKRDQPSAAKRRKKKSRRSACMQHGLRNHMKEWIDHSWDSDKRNHEDRDGWMSTSPASEESAGEDAGAMDVT